MTGGDPFQVFRPDIPSPARMYDYYLGGKDHFPADREAAERVIEQMPHGTVRTAARQNRAFLQRAVRYLVTEAGMRQFVDIGAGMPTMGPVHEVAEEIALESRTVYVDNDLVVLAHGRDLLSGAQNATIIQHDVRDYDAIIADPELRMLIDLDRPVTVLLVAILHFIGDEDDPRGIIRGLLDPLPSGSHLVLAHATADSHPELDTAVRAYRKATSSAYSRTKTEIRKLLEGFELVDPGLVWAPQWRPDPDTPLQDHPEESLNYTAVARKP